MLEVRISRFQLACEIGLLFLKVQVVPRRESVMRQFCWRNFNIADITLYLSEILSLVTFLENTSS